MFTHFIFLAFFSHISDQPLIIHHAPFEIQVLSQVKEFQNTWNQIFNSRVHPDIQSVENIRQHISQADYIRALTYIDENLFQKKSVKEFEVSELAKLFESISQILIAHPSLEVFSSDEINEELERFQISKNRKKYLNAGALVCEDNAAYEWIVKAVGIALSPEKKTMYIEGNKDACYAMAYLSRKNFKNGGVRNSPIDVYDPKFSIIDPEQIQKEIYNYLGEKQFKKLISEYAKAREEGRPWSYPGVVSHIPKLKKPAKELFLDYARNFLDAVKTKDAYSAAAFAHQEWIHLHMLVDGNGRMGRLLANIVLADANLPLMLVTDDREYTDVVSKSLENYEDFVPYLQKFNHAL